MPGIELFAKRQPPGGGPKKNPDGKAVTWEEGIKDVSRDKKAGVVVTNYTSMPPPPSFGIDNDGFGGDASSFGVSSGSGFGSSLSSFDPPFQPSNTVSIC